MLIHIFNARCHCIHFLLIHVYWNCVVDFECVYISFSDRHLIASVSIYNCTNCIVYFTISRLQSQCTNIKYKLYELHINFIVTRFTIRLCHQSNAYLHRLSQFFYGSIWWKRQTWILCNEFLLHWVWLNTWYFTI